MGFIDTVKKAAALDKVNAEAINNDRQALNEALKDREISPQSVSCSTLTYSPFLITYRYYFFHSSLPLFLICGS